MTYREATSRVDSLHAGLMLRNGLPPNDDGMRLMAIFMKNCPEWVVAEQACFAAGGATVPLYDTLGPDVVEFILKQTGAPTVVCGKASEVRAVIAVADKCPSLKLIIAVEPAAAAEPGTPQVSVEGQ